jgi:hypothetical protein
MRRMVRALVEDLDVGDVSTLKNPESVAELTLVIAAWKARQQLADDQQMFERFRYFTVQYNGDGAAKVATVTITNPPVNALNERALDELGVVVEHLARRDDVAAIVFTGQGTASFVAGADIRQLLEDIRTIDEARALPNNAHLAFRKIERMTKPCIAAIQGVALGGGLEFALACHFRVAEPTASEPPLVRSEPEPVVAQPSTGESPLSEPTPAGNGEAIARALAASKRAAVRACFESELKQQPTLRGNVLVEFDLAPPDRVIDVRVSDDLERPSFTRCVSDEMHRVRFAALDEELSVAVPYVLSPERK